MQRAPTILLAVLPVLPTLVAFGTIVTADDLLRIFTATGLGTIVTGCIGTRILTPLSFVTFAHGDCFQVDPYSNVNKSKKTLLYEHKHI